MSLMSTNYIKNNCMLNVCKIVLIVRELNNPCKKGTLNRIWDI